MSRAEHVAPPGFGTRRRALAWSVHVLTASGAAVGLAALLATARGAPRAALLWMLVALVIDSVDGTLARRADVEHWVPRIDGRRLDDIVDYLNYVIVPLFFLAWTLRIEPLWVAALPVLASAYGFSQTEAKTEDGYFLGFPSYWNVVALYAFLLDLSAPVIAGWLVVLSIGVFVPLKYLYPSQMTAWGRVMNVGAGVWILAVTALLIWWPERPGQRGWAWLTLAYPVAYVLLSFWLGGAFRRSSR
jgi:phosphatidylcholine synthase